MEIMSIHILIKEKIITYNDYNSLFKELREKHQNCIFVNSPTDTPLAKKNSLNFPLEIKWVINNSGVGHGYEDETDINVLLNLFNEQKQKLNEDIALNGVEL